MKRLVFILCIAFCFASCGNKDDEPAPTPPATAERTLLVYMVANNDLGQRGYDDADITEMRAAARSGGLGKGRLLLMHQSSKGRSVLKEINTKGNIDTLLIYDDAEPTVSIARMTRVFDDMKRLAPAETYGLVLWSHGSGWLEDGWADPDAGKKRAFGLDGTRSMNITSLAQALQGRGFDYVYFDCCHMASVEVAYELRNATDYIVGSVTELPNYGMPYDANIPLLLKREPDLKGAAANTFNLYDEKTGSAPCLHNGHPSEFRRNPSGLRTRHYMPFLRHGGLYGAYCHRQGGAGQVARGTAPQCTVQCRHSRDIQPT